MQWVYPFRRRNSCEDGMSLICSHFWAYEPQAMSRPMHMLYRLLSGAYEQGGRP